MKLCSSSLLLALMALSLPISAFSQVPSVVSVNPAQNALNVAKNTSITATFDVEMDSSSINSSSFVVSASQTGSHSGTITYDTGNESATFTLSTSFAVGELVSVVLTTEVSSADETPLPSHFMWSFTVGPEGGLGFYNPHSSIPVAGTTPNTICGVDIDSDGDIDLITSDFGSSSLSVLINSGEGMFTTDTAVLVESAPHDVAACDLDRDGDMDIIAANHYSSSISILYNSGGGSFQSYLSHPVGNMPAAIATADFDGDGDPDIATSNYGNASISLVFNEGGTYSSAVPYSVGANPRFVSTADLNSDGHTDIVSASEGNPNVSVFMNDGNGVFTLDSTYSAGTTPTSGVVADLDGDGDIDLAVGHRLVDSVTIFINDGSGIFVDQYSYSVGEYPYSVAAVDFNHDSVLDLVSSNIDSDNVTLLQNDGTASFSPSMLYLLGGRGPNDVVAFDCDGDGDMDLATANSFSDDVSLLSNDTAFLPLPNLALSFDGNDQVMVPHNSTLSFSEQSPFTIECWFMRAVSRVPYHLVAKRSGCSIDLTNYQIAGDDIQLLNFESATDMLHTGVDPQVGEWMHSAVTYDGSLLSFYLDGELQAATPFSIGGENTDPLKFGVAGTACPINGRLIGQMDEVRFWNVARDSAEIAAYYNHTAHPNSPGLIGYWPFDEVPGSQFAEDISGYDNPGILGADGGPDGEDPIRVVSTAPILKTEYDAAAIRIASPTGEVLLWEILEPQVVVMNLGLEQSDIPVTFSIPGMDYSEQTSVTVPSGDSILVMFPEKIASEVGGFGIEAYVGVSSDIFGGNDTIAASFNIIDDPNAPIVSDITPSLGGNTGYVTTLISGSNFEEGISVFLIKEGADTILIDETQAYVLNSDTMIVELDLRETETGLWSVVAKNTSGSMGVLWDGFEIEIGHEEFWVNIVGNDAIRPGRPHTYLLTYGNSGNIDVYSTLVLIESSVNTEIQTSLQSYWPPDEHDDSTLNQLGLSITSMPPDSAGSIVFYVTSHSMEMFSLDVKAWTMSAQLNENNPFTYDRLYSSYNSWPPYPPQRGTIVVQSIPDCYRQAGIVYQDGESDYYVWENLPGGTRLTSWDDFCMLSYPSFPDMSQGLQLYYEPLLTDEEMDSLNDWLLLHSQYGGQSLPFVFSLKSIGAVDSAFTASINHDLFPDLRDSDPSRNDQACKAAIREPELRRYVNMDACKHLIKKGMGRCCFCADDVPSCEEGVSEKKCKKTYSGDFTEGEFCPCMIDPCDDATNTYSQAASDDQRHEFYSTSVYQIPTMDMIYWFGDAASRIEGLRSCLPDGEDSDSIQPIGPWDPNDKAGPTGYGESKHIKQDGEIAYIVYFENDTSAASYAEDIWIVDTLSEYLDWTTLEFEAVYPGDGPDSIRPDYYYEINFDETTGEVTWSLLNIMLPPDTAVYLPPDSAVEYWGEGWVSFSVMPRDNLPSGTVIENIAAIKFDYNDWILAPMDSIPIFNTIDAKAPSSYVQSLPDTTTSSDFNVTWYGEDEDNGSGIRSYNIYVSTDHGPFELWIPEDTLRTSATYNGENGHDYAFYSVARDNVGHIEITPQDADAHTIVYFEYICGDADGSDSVDIDDVVYLINYIFAGGPTPEPYESGDANCSGGVDIDDVVYIIAYIFSGGNSPCDMNGDEVPDC